MESPSSESEAAVPEPSRERVWLMFDRIAPRYDMLNRLLSGRRDVAWRRTMAQALRDRGSLDVLDLATGTADQLFSLRKAGIPLGRAVGLDMSTGMLEKGREKLRQADWTEKVDLVKGDACALPFEADSFDAITMSFGIRNVENMDVAMQEMARVLRPGSRALILEFSLPEHSGMRKSYLWYLRNVLPRLGGALSGDASAYRYLNQTIETFPYGEAFLAHMRDAGFTNLVAQPLTGGIASLYRGDLPSAGNHTTGASS